jgi:hypothetical protein
MAASKLWIPWTPDTTIQMSEKNNFQSQTEIVFGLPIDSVPSASLDDSEGMYVLN